MDPTCYWCLWLILFWACLKAQNKSKEQHVWSILQAPISFSQDNAHFDTNNSMVSHINQTDCFDHDLATIAIARGTVRLSHWRFFGGSAAAASGPAGVSGRGVVPAALRLQALLQHLRRQGLGEALRRLQVSAVNNLVKTSYQHLDMYVGIGHVTHQIVGWDFSENTPGVTSFALAVSSLADWLGHEASSRGGRDPLKPLKPLELRSFGEGPSSPL